MAADPEVVDIDCTDFSCYAFKVFHIFGNGFAKNVTVELEETGDQVDHEWIPCQATWRSNATSDSEADGHVIEINAKPRKCDGTSCDDDGYGLGDLTVTVTNNDDSGDRRGRNRSTSCIIHDHKRLRGVLACWTPVV